MGSVDGLVATVDATVGYTLIVDALADAPFNALRGKSGVTSCSRRTLGDGSVELELTLAHETALTEVLRHLLFNHVTITRCNARETSLEETFRAVFGQTAPAPAAGAATVRRR
jgi:hypothetical protein